MKSFFQRSIALMIMSTIYLIASAYDFEVNGVFYDISSFTDLTVTAVSLSEDCENEVTIPSTVVFNGKELRVTKIGANFALNNVSIMSVTLGAEVETICKRAFNNCINLQRVTLSNVISIEEEAFKDCVALEVVNSLNTVTSVELGAFRNCQNIDNIDISGIERIPAYCFAECRSLETIQLSDNLVTIGAYAFEDTGFAKFEIPNTVTNIGSSILNKCSQLTSFTIGSGISNLETDPIYECPIIEELIISDSNQVLQINFSGERYASKFMDGTYYNFYYNSWKDLPIKKIYLGREVITRNNVCPPFYGIESLYELVIGSSVIDLPYSRHSVNYYSAGTYGYFENCVSLSDLTIGTNLSVISRKMFKNSGLIGCNLSAGVTRIDNEAFAECKALKSILIDKSCVEIGENVFEGDDLLERISLMPITPPACSTVFSNAQYINLDICVPPQTISSYKNADPWKNFWKIQEDDNLISEFSVNSLKYELIDGENVALVGFEDVSFESLVIPEQVTYRGKDFNIKSLNFAGQVLLNCTEVSVNNSIEILPTRIFSGWINLKIVDLGSCRYIDNEVFNECRALEELTIPGTCNYIGSNVFNGCTSLQSVCFEYSETPITLGCNSKLHLSQTVTPHPNPSDVDERRMGFRNGYYDGLFFGLPVERLIVNRNIELQKYSERVQGASDYYYTTIYDDIIFYSPFYGLTELKYVEIGEEVSAICKNTIEAVMNAVPTTVNYENFGDCQNIQVVISNNPEAPIGGGFSETVYEGATLFIPNGNEESYSNDTNWGHFKKIKVSNFEPIESFSLGLNYITLNINEAIQVPYTIAPENASIQKFSWQSSDPEIVQVSDEGIIYSNDIEGEVIITATTVDTTNLSSSITVTVKDRTAKSIELDYTAVSLNSGATLQLSATVGPADTLDKSITWMSSDESIASVSNDGLITAISNGNATISATCGKVSATCEVEVYTLVESIEIQPKSIRLATEETHRLSLSALPEEASDKSVEWSSSDDSVAGVFQSGLVYAVADGTCYIIAKTRDGSNLTAKCQVEVYSVSGEDSLHGNKILIQSINSVIRILGKEALDIVRVYNQQGVEVIMTTDNEIILDHPGIYIVKVNGIVQKIAI